MRCAFKRLGCSGRDNRHRLQSAGQSFRTELSVRLSSVFNLDFVVCGEEVANRRLTFQRSLPGVLKRDHCEPMTDKWRPLAETQSVPRIGLATTDVPQSSKTKYAIDSFKQPVLRLDVVYWLDMRFSKRLQYVVAARPRSDGKQNLRGWHKSFYDAR